MKHILFVCSGNYYRSRFAEEYFNYFAIKNQIPWKAYSKGLSQNMPSPNNPGPISAHTLDSLSDRGIPGLETNRFPKPIMKEDFQEYHKIIAMSELEHKPMIEKRFLVHADKVGYFEVGDLPLEDPKKAMPRIASLVNELLEKVEDETNTSLRQASSPSIHK